MIGIINSLTKSGFDKCTVPSNKLCNRVLAKIRESNGIMGYSHAYSRRRSSFKGHPLTSIHMRLTEHRASLLKSVKVYKNTSLNFLNARNQYIKSQYTGPNSNLIVTSPAGLVVSNSHEYWNRTLKRRKNSRILCIFEV